jgi:ABC-2 type transport system ATP-binding protein
MTRSQRVQPIVKAEKLSKLYGPFVAIRDVSFEIAPGQVVALLGPNGAGKTTIMRMLTGFLAPTSGRASVCGFDVEQDRSLAAAALGYLPENGPLYPDMTPGEVLRFFGAARGLPPAALRERLAVVTAACDIEAILDKAIGKLSKGLRQRVGLAQALLHDPKAIIMDEPTAGLDPIQILHFRAHIRHLSREKTLLMSTHILQEVEAVADRVLVMSGGRLVFDGPTSELGHGAALEARFFELTRTSS